MDKEKKQYFENEEEAREIYSKFHEYCKNKNKGNCANAGCTDCWVEYVKENGYIKQSELEKAEEDYIVTKKFIESKCGAREPHTTTVFINELKKEIERLKK